jgi:hypothetical protein
VNNLGFLNSPSPPLVSISGLAFSGGVEYATLAAQPRFVGLTFSDCSLDSGFNQVQSLDPVDIGTLTLRNCRLGAASSARVDRVVMDADTISIPPSPNTRLHVAALPLPPAGGASWSLSIASVAHCIFLGGGLTLSGNPYATIASNRIEHCASGITVLDAAAALVDSNVVLGCDTGVLVTGSGNIEIVANSVSECGIGLYSGNADDVRFRANRVTGSGNQGILADGGTAVLVERNIIVGGGRGPRIETGYAEAGIMIGYAWGVVTVQNNTVAMDRGAGIGLDHLYYEATVKDNIAFRNQGWGLMAELAQGWGTIALGCNDWFGNALGAVNGAPADPTDVDVDPIFCNVDNADVSLDSASPLIADSASCGQVGAVGVGCGTTPTLVLRFAAGRVGEGIQVTWEVARLATTTKIWLERSEKDDQGPWVVPLTDRTNDGQAVVEVDRGVALDRPYWYRLIAQEVNAAVVIGAPIMVGAQAPVEFRLSEVGPNPGGGPVRISFALKHAANIEIDVFDVQGRKVASPAGGVWAAGSHGVDWDGKTRGGDRAPAGLYFVRYTFPGGQDRRPIIRMR